MSQNVLLKHNLQRILENVIFCVVIDVTIPVMINALIAVCKNYCVQLREIGNNKHISISVKFMMTVLQLYTKQFEMPRGRS